MRQLGCLAALLLLGAAAHAQDSGVGGIPTNFGMRNIPYSAAPYSAGQVPTFNASGISFTASIAGNVMTVTAMAPGSDPIPAGSFVVGAGVPSGTQIINQVGVWTGGTGTYTLNTLSTVASEAMTIGEMQPASPSVPTCGTVPWVAGDILVACPDGKSLQDSGVVPSGGSAAASQLQEFFTSASMTWTTPTGTTTATRFVLDARGPGGTGGNAGAGAFGVGAGAGGKCHAILTSLSPGTSITIAISGSSTSVTVGTTTYSASAGANGVTSTGGAGNIGGAGGGFSSSCDPVQSQIGEDGQPGVYGYISGKGADAGGDGSGGAAVVQAGAGVGNPGKGCGAGGGGSYGNSVLPPGAPGCVKIRWNQ